MPLYSCNHRNRPQTKRSAKRAVKDADMFSAMGTEARLRIGVSESASAEFSSCEPRAPPSTYAFKLIRQYA